MRAIRLLVVALAILVVGSACDSPTGPRLSPPTSPVGAKFPAPAFSRRGNYAIAW